jgi:membrane protein DedA with SNARE-associated domain
VPPHAAKSEDIVTEQLIQYIEWGAAQAPVWGLLIVFVLMTIESSFIPFPSEVVMIPAGFLAARGEMTFGQGGLDASAAVAAGILGSLVGAYINYFLALWLGRPFLHKYGKYFFLSPPTVQRAEEIFLEYGPGTTFVCRLLPAIRQLISIPAGMARMPLGIFTLCTGLGAGIWVIVLTGIGYYFGSKTVDMSYADLVHRGKDILNANLVWIVAGCVVFFALYVYVHKKIMHGRGPVAAAEADDMPPPRG